MPCAKAECRPAAGRRGCARKAERIGIVYPTYGTVHHVVRLRRVSLGGGGFRFLISLGPST